MREQSWRLKPMRGGTRAVSVMLPATLLAVAGYRFSWNKGEIRGVHQVEVAAGRKLLPLGGEWRCH